MGRMCVSLFIATVLLCALCSGWALGCWWLPIADEDNEDYDDVNNDTYISWSVTTNADGSEAIANVWPINKTDGSYHGITKHVSCSQMRGRVWVTRVGDPPEPAHFTLSWTGGVGGNPCTVTAKKADDFAKAMETAYSKVTSDDFGDAEEKWSVRSDKGAELPANPNEGEESKISLSGTVEITDGLPTGYSGNLEWDFRALSSGERSAAGEEASQTYTAQSASTSFDHPGGPGSDTRVDAMANLTVDATYEYDCGNSLGHGVDGQAYAKAYTSSLVVSVN